MTEKKSDEQIASQDRVRAQTLQAHLERYQADGAPDAMLIRDRDLLVRGFEEVRAERDAELGWRPCDPESTDALDELFPRTQQTRVLYVVQRGSLNDRVICLGWWDMDKQRWIDEETDGGGDRIEYAPGDVTHWRELPALPCEPPPVETKACPECHGSGRDGPDLDGFSMKCADCKGTGRIPPSVAAGGSEG